MADRHCARKSQIGMYGGTRKAARPFNDERYHLIHRARPWPCDQVFQPFIPDQERDCIGQEHGGAAPPCFGVDQKHCSDNDPKLAKRSDHAVEYRTTLSKAGLWSSWSAYKMSNSIKNTVLCGDSDMSKRYAEKWQTPQTAVIIPQRTRLFKLFSKQCRGGYLQK